MPRKRQVFRSVWPRHKRPILAACQTVLNPGRILVTSDADAQVERAATAPAVKDISMRALLAVLAFLLLEEWVEHKTHGEQTSIRDPTVGLESPSWCKTRCRSTQRVAPTLQFVFQWL